MSNHSYRSVDTMLNIQNILMHISIPYIIIVTMIGIPGNVLTIIMLSKRSLTKNFNNCTLIALATTDLLFNLTLVSRCIIDLTLSISVNFCEVLAFLSHLAELLSACFTVHFTVQRFIAVRFPLSVFIEKNIHFLHYGIVTLFILLGVSYCFALIKKNDYENCQEALDLNWFYSDAILSFVVPFATITILNLLIILRLRKTSRKSQQLSFTKRSKHNPLPLHSRKKFSISYDSNSHLRLSDNSSGPNIKSSIYQFSTNGEANEQFLSVGPIRPRTASIRSTTRHHAQSHRVTRMLIIVSTCFLLLNAPAHICAISLKLYTIRQSHIMNNTTRLANINFLNNSNQTNIEYLNLFSSTTIRNQSKANFKVYQIFYIILIICQHIAYLSYSINFFLYSFCGMKFRGELMKFISHCRKYGRHIQTPRQMARQNSI